MKYRKTTRSLFVLAFMLIRPLAHADTSSFPVECLGARADEDQKDTHHQINVTSEAPHHTFEVPNADVTVRSSLEKRTGDLAFPSFKVSSSREPFSVETRADDLHRLYGLYSADGDRQPHGVVCNIGQSRAGRMPTRKAYSFACTRRRNGERLIASARGKWSSGFVPLQLDLEKKHTSFQVAPRAPKASVGMNTEGHFTIQLDMNFRNGKLKGGSVVEFQPSPTRTSYHARFVVRSEDRPKLEVIDCRLKAL